MNVNIHASSQLFTFNVSISSVTLTRKTPCLAASPIISSRHNVYDTLVVDLEGSLALITSNGRSIPVAAPRPTGDSRDEVARRMASTLNMQIDMDDSMRSKTDYQAIIALRHASGSTVTLKSRDREDMRVSLDFTIKDSLVRHCIEAISYALPAASFFAFKRELLIRSQDDVRGDRDVCWANFGDTIRSVLRVSSARAPRDLFDRLSTHARQGRSSIARRIAEARSIYSTVAEGSHTSRLAYGETLDHADAGSIVFALHLVGQDHRLMADTQDDLPRLGDLLLVITGHFGMTQWFDYWRRLMPNADSRIALSGTSRSVG